MRKILVFPILLVLILFVAVQISYSASLPTLTYYEAANQFATNSNPNGTWTYGYSTKVGGSLIAYTISGQCPGDYNGWYGSTLCGTPLVVAQPDVPDKQLLTLHPGLNNEQSVVRWTALATGTYDFYGYFSGLDATGGADVSVLKNKVSIFHAIVVGQGDTQGFNLALPLRKGDNIDFVVATQSGGPSGGTLTGLAVAITPQLFTFTTVQYPAFPHTEVWGINNLGDIVGRYKTPDNVSHGYMRKKGVFTTIDYPGAAHTFLAKINTWGHVVGFAFSADFSTLTSFTWRDGKFTDVAYPGALFTQALSINDLGYITGNYAISDPNTNIGFVRSPDGNFFSFAVPQAPLYTVPESINLLGQIVGWYIDDATGNYYGFLRNPNDKYSTINFPGADFGTFSHASNVWGTITGAYYGGAAMGQGFLLVGSTYMPFWIPQAVAPGALYTEGIGINDLGQVCGRYYDADFNVYGYTATPVLPFKH